MLVRTRRFGLRLHRDESGPNTVEWVLLIIVALLVLLGIYLFINKVVMPAFDDAANAIENESQNVNSP